MLLKKITSNHSYNLIIFPVLGIVFWLRNLFSPQPYEFFPGENHNLLYALTINLLQSSVFLQNLIALFLLLLMAFIILQINNRYSIIKIRTMIPATIFVILAGGFTSIHALHPVYFAAVFFLLALYRLFNAYELPQPYSPAFDTGFFLGISALFYFNILVFLPALLIGIGIIAQESKWRKFIILITGVLVPFIFAISYTFLTDSIAELAEIFKANILTANYHYFNNTVLQIYTVFLLILTLLGSFIIIKEYDTKKVITRKYFIVFFLIFLSSVAGLFIIPAVSQEILLVLIIPVSFLVTNLFISMKGNFWSELLFALMLVIVIALQIFT